MYDYCIIIPTYCRAKLLYENVIERIQKDQSEDTTIYNIILDDGSPLGMYSDIFDYNKKNYKIYYQRHPQNNGRFFFWKTYTTLMQLTKNVKYKYLISLPDDNSLCDNFLEEATKDFEKYREEDKLYVCMNLAWNHSLTCWGQEGYQDGCYIAVREFVEALDFRVQEIPLDRWIVKKNKKTKIRQVSSGVHAQLTNRIYFNSIYKIVECYKVNKRYLITQNDPIKKPSMMYKENYNKDIYLEYLNNNYNTNQDESLIPKWLLKKQKNKK
jgi:hypothetical protein